MPKSNHNAPTGAPSRTDSIRKIDAHLTGERLEKLLDNQRLMLFNVSAILGHATEALDTHADPINGSVSQTDATDVQCALKGAQKLVNDAANALELPALEDEASRLAHREQTERWMAARRAEAEGAES